MLKDRYLTTMCDNDKPLQAMSKSTQGVSSSSSLVAEKLLHNCAPPSWNAVCMCVHPDV